MSELYHEIINQIYPIPVEIYHNMLELDAELEKTELWEGVIIKKMTKSSEHNFYVNLLFQQLNDVKPKGTFVQSEKTIQLQRSELEPDISVVEGSIWDFLKQHPRKAVLVVEISKTPLAQDRKKGKLYAEAEVEEYWIVDIKAKAIEVYTNPSNTNYQNRTVYDFTTPIPAFGGNISLVKER